MSQARQLDLSATEAIARALAERRASEELLRRLGHAALAPEEEAARERRTLQVIDLLDATRTRTGTSRAARVAYCGAPVIAQLTEPAEGPRDIGGAAPRSELLPATWSRLSCRARWCPACQRARAEELVPRIAEWIAGRRERGAALALLTLTRRRAEGEAAAAAVDAVLAAWNRLTRRASWRPVVGFLRVLEVVARRAGEVMRVRGSEIRARSTGVHAHLHAVIEVELTREIAELQRCALPELRGLEDLRRDERARPHEREAWARGVARGRWWTEVRADWLELSPGARGVAQDLRWMAGAVTRDAQGGPGPEALREARELGAYAVDGLASLIEEATQDPRRRAYAREVLSALDGRRTLATGGTWSARAGGLNLRPQPRLRGLRIAASPLWASAMRRSILWQDGHLVTGDQAERLFRQIAEGPPTGLAGQVRDFLAQPS